MSILCREGTDLCQIDPNMEILTHLAPPLLAHFRRVARPDHAISTATDWRDVTVQIRRRVLDTIVLDPMADGTMRTDEIVSIGRRFPAQSIVLYLVLSPPGLQSVVELARQGVSQVVLHRFDDDLQSFRALLGLQRGSGLADRLLEELKDNLDVLATPLSMAVRELIQRPHRFASAQDLAREAGVPRRSMYRDMEAAGFSSPRNLVGASRLLRAFLHLKEPGYSVADVSEKLAYSAPRALLRQSQELTGLMPSELRDAVSDEEFLERLLFAIREGKRLPPPETARRRRVHRMR